jgi:fructokinase
MRPVPRRGAVIGTPIDNGIVAVAGEALVDLVPAPVSGYYEFAPGGSPANVAVGLSRLGVGARMLARIAEDPLGQRLREHLGGNGVQLDHVVTATEQTSMAIVMVGPDGGPTYDFRVSGTADWQWTETELEHALDPGENGPVVAVHSGSLALTTPPGDAALRGMLARAAETATVSYDPNCRPALMGKPADVLATAHELLRVADVVKVSLEDLDWLMPGFTPDEVLEDWLGRGPAIVAVTLGGDGVVAGTSTGLHTRRPGVPVTVIDTVGAGDTFSAGLLAGLHRRRLLGAAARPALHKITHATLDALLDEAMLAAAITCSRRGADPPTAEDLDARRSWAGLKLVDDG